MTQLNLGGAVKTVTSAGTAEALVSTRTLVNSITVRALVSNTGNVFFGNSQVDSTQAPLAAGDILTKTSEEVGGTPIGFDLAQVFIDVSVSGEGADFWYD
jgi:hypothetical protein